MNRTARLTLAILAGLLASSAPAQTIPSGAYATLTGRLSSSNGLPAANNTLSFKLTQPALIAGSGIVLADASQCFTSTDGSVVGVQNPLTIPVLSAQYSGTLTAGNYYVQIAYNDASGNETLPSPEAVVQLSGTGGITVAPPTSGYPSGATGMRVYIGTSSGSESLQGAAVPTSGPYVRSSSLAVGVVPQTVNGTVCRQVANDAMWPTVGYTVSLTNTAGNSAAGFPMTWQLLGPGSTINLGSGLPTWRGGVTYPAGVLQQPLAHALQSISGPVSMAGYNLFGIGKLGIGTSTPGYALDVQGIANAQGWVYNGGAGVSPGQCLVAATTAPYTFGPAPCSNVTPYYQIVALAGVGHPQRPILDFSDRFAISETGSTEVDLGASGVNPGNYANPTLTVDSYGRITNVQAGSAVNRVCGSNGCYRREADGTITAWGQVVGSFLGSTLLNQPIVFPVGFTTIPSIMVSAANQPDGSDDGLSVYHKADTVNGTTAVVRCVLNIGGAGCPSSLTATIPISWTAIGY